MLIILVLHIFFSVYACRHAVGVRRQLVVVSSHSTMWVQEMELSLQVWQQEPYHLISPSLTFNSR